MSLGGVDASADLRSRLLGRAAAAGIELPEALADSLLMYYQLLARWNRKINLAGLLDRDAALDRLLLEPVSAAAHLPASARILDIGSGGGSPAIPLRLSLPNSLLTMVEARVRKAAFLREAVRQLSLGTTPVYQARFQELVGRPDLQGQHDVLTVRAMRLDRAVLETLATFLTPAGSIVLFQGSTLPGWLPSESRVVPLFRSSHVVFIPRSSVVE
jgi:16S rRNA (guanine527-N7)-methyltransferase